MRNIVCSYKNEAEEPIICGFRNVDTYISARSRSGNYKCPHVTLRRVGHANNWNWPSRNRVPWSRTCRRKRHRCCSSSDTLVSSARTWTCRWSHRGRTRASSPVHIRGRIRSWRSLGDWLRIARRNCTSPLRRGFVLRNKQSYAL